MRYKDKPPSEAQLRYLKYLGSNEEPETMKEASKLIEELKNPQYSLAELERMLEEGI